MSQLIKKNKWLLYSDRRQDGRAPGAPTAPGKGEEPAEKTKWEQTEDPEDPDKVGSQKLREILLQVFQNLTYAHHAFESMVVIAPTIEESCL